MNYTTSTVLFLVVLSWLFSACTTGTGKDNQKQSTLPAKKIVTIGGTISEIVYALGNGEEIVATDRTSVYPEKLQLLASVGYRNSIKAEGVLSTGADLILAEEEHVSADVATQLKAAGLDYYQYKNEFSPESTKAIIRNIAAILGKEEKGKELIATLDEDLQQVSELLKAATNRPKVLFVYARGQGTLSVCGRKSFAESMITLAGGQLATPEFEGFKPLTPEALISSNPDYILFFDSGLESLGGIEGVMALKGVTETKAGKNKNIIAMEGLYLSGFGPRVGKAVQDLSKLIHPELQASNLSRN
jgi:iron complex transport system substrate-binding protein